MSVWNHARVSIKDESHEDPLLEDSAPVSLADPLPQCIDRADMLQAGRPGESNCTKFVGTETLLVERPASLTFETRQSATLTTRCARRSPMTQMEPRQIRFSAVSAKRGIMNLAPTPQIFMTNVLRRNIMIKQY
jgi:hypothetical protein